MFDEKRLYFPDFFQTPRHLAILSDKFCSVVGFSDFTLFTNCVGVSLVGDLAYIALQLQSEMGAIV